jgi:hypothetical protein
MAYSKNAVARLFCFGAQFGMMVFFASIAAADVPMPSAESWMPPTPDSIRAEWYVHEEIEKTRSISIKGGYDERFFTISPIESYISDTDVIISNNGRVVEIPKRVVFVRMQGKNNIICELTRRTGQRSFGCLTDINGDGIYDVFQRAAAGSDLMMRGLIQSDSFTLLEPIKLERVPQGESSASIDFFIEFTNRASIAKESDFHVCTRPKNRYLIRNIMRGGPLVVCINGTLRLKDRELPYTTFFFGNTITFQSYAKGHVSVQINYPDGPQVIK